MARRTGFFGAPLTDYIRFGFGVGIGHIIALILLTLIAAAFFIPGFVLVMREKKKAEADKSTGLLVTGFVLMGIGMVIGIGFGGGAFFSLLADQM